MFPNENLPKVMVFRCSPTFSRYYFMFPASVSRDQTVQVFDIRSMTEWVVLRGHKKEVVRPVFLV